MTQDSGGRTNGHGGDSTPNSTSPRDENGAGSDVVGNVAETGREPSPSDPERREASGPENGAAIDMDTAHERAS